MHVRAVTAFSIFCFACAMFSGCPRDPREREGLRTVAFVGEEPISRSVFVAELARAGLARLENREEREKVARGILERLVRESLLVRAARERGYSVTEAEVERALKKSVDGYLPGTFLRVLHAEQLTLDQYRDKIHRRLLVESMLQDRMSRHPPITDAELQKRYESTRGVRKQESQVRVRQVLVRTQEEAEYLLREIQSRRISLEEAARRYSVSPEKERGGDLGWFAKSEMPTAFERCFVMQPGEVSDVVASEYGFHLFELIEKRPALKAPFSEQKTRLVAEIRHEREQNDIDELVRELRKGVQIDVEEVSFQAALKWLRQRPAPSSDVPHREQP